MVLLYITRFATLLATLQIGSTQVTVGAGVTLAWQADGVGTSFLITVFVISASVLVWSYYYLDREAEFKILTATTLAFIGSMAGLVLRLSLPTLFVCWDLLGFTSFFLVAYYRTRSALAATLLTGLTNRVGDCALLLLLGLSWGFDSASVPAVVLLVAAAMTKSAQLPFSAWLPAAMSAPTPVSALVHSSTLVTAGVYLLYRFNGLPSIVLLRVGLATTALARAAACLEADIKKVVALSTLRHLGLIFVALGLSEKTVAFAHLSLHASSKALLFLGVGTAMHSAYGSQELRAGAALPRRGPGLLLVIQIAVMSLSGLYYMAGCASKDAILWSMFGSGASLCGLGVLMGSVCFRVGYGTRLLLALAWCKHQQGPAFGHTRLVITTKAGLARLAALAVAQGVVFGAQYTL